MLQVLDKDPDRGTEVSAQNGQRREWSTKSTFETRVYVGMLKGVSTHNTQDET